MICRFLCYFRDWREGQEGFFWGGETERLGATPSSVIIIKAFVIGTQSYSDILPSRLATRHCLPPCTGGSKQQLNSTLLPLIHDCFFFFLSLVNQRGKKILWIQISKLMQTKKKRKLGRLGVEKLWLAPIKLVRLSDCRSWKRNLGGECWLLSRRWRRFSVHVDRSVRPLGVKKNDSVGAGSEDWLILSPSLLSLCWSKSTAPRWQWTKPRRDRENRDRKRGQRI